MQPSDIYHWQQTVWQGLLEQPGKLPHAMLLIGRAGIGKGAFADALAARLLCERASGAQYACGKCEGCLLLASKNHPDYRKVSLEEEVEGESSEIASTKKSKGAKRAAAPSTQIKISQIRVLEDFVYVGSHRQGSRVVVIDPADAMNLAAANALLKILEEPPASVYFILVSSNDKRLLPTLRSRCRQIAFGIPSSETAMQWLATQKLPKAEQLLALASGSPLKAAEMSRDGLADAIDEAVAPLMQQGAETLAVAAHWDSVRRKHAGLDLEMLVDSVQKWMYDLIRVQRDSAPRFFVGRTKELTAMAARAPASRLQRSYADLLKIRAVARHPLNELLFLEDMAARCIAGLGLSER